MEMVVTHKIEPFVSVFTLFNTLFDSLRYYRNYVSKDDQGTLPILKVLRMR